MEENIGIDDSTNETYNIVTEILSVYSGDRNASSYPNPESYTIDFNSLVNKDYRNVISIRLISGVFPDQNNVLQEPYLVLHINEINSPHIAGTSSVLNSGSTILQLDKSLTPTYFFNLKSDICKCLFSSFSQPIARLSRFTIKITDALGNLFSFGSDTNPVNKSLQHLLVFEIKYREKKKTINIQNVY